MDRAPSLSGSPASPLWLAAAGALAVAVGLAASQTLPLALLGVAAVTAGALVLWAVIHPREAVSLLFASAIFFPTFILFGSRGVNPIDVLLLPVLFAAWFWYRGAAGEEHTPPPVRRALRWTVGSALAYYGLAALSLVPMVLGGHAAGAVDSLLILSRGFQGALYFYLAVRLVRSAADLRRARSAVLAGFLLACAVNGLGFAFGDLQRAGSVWVPMAGSWILGNPNEAALSVVLIWALLIGFPMGRWLTGSLVVLSLVFLLATASRSGLLAAVTFVLAYGVTTRRLWIWGLPVGFAALYPLLPGELAGRLARSVILQPGSFEAFSALVRVYAWKASWDTFLAHPLFGVGFLGFRYVSHRYNELGIVLFTAENMYLETAAGLGILGLAALLGFGIGLYRLGRAVRRTAAPGSAAARLGSAVTPFLLGHAVSCLTGDNLIGLLATAQMALLAGLLVAASRVAAQPPDDARAAR